MGSKSNVTMVLNVLPPFRLNLWHILKGCRATNVTWQLLLLRLSLFRFATDCRNLNANMFTVQSARWCHFTQLFYHNQSERFNKLIKLQKETFKSGCNFLNTNAVKVASNLWNCQILRLECPCHLLFKMTKLSLQ